MALAPGIYRWRVRSPTPAEGVVAVERFSAEFVPRPRIAPASAAPGVRQARVGLRDLWWGFGIALVALLAEWAWRVRRGLP